MDLVSLLISLNNGSLDGNAAGTAIPDKSLGGLESSLFAKPSRFALFRKNKPA